MGNERYWEVLKTFLVFQVRRQGMHLSWVRLSEETEEIIKEITIPSLKNFADVRSFVDFLNESPNVGYEEVKDLSGKISLVFREVLRGSDQIQERLYRQFTLERGMKIVITGYKQAYLFDQNNEQQRWGSGAEFIPYESQIQCKMHNLLTALQIIFGVNLKDITDYPQNAVIHKKMNLSVYAIYSVEGRDS